MIKTLEAFDKFLMSREDWQQRSHHASGISACRRAQFYGWTGEEKSDPPTPGAILKMRMGKAAERIFEDFLIWAVENEELLGDKKLAGYNREVQVRVEVPELKHPVSGRIDYMLYFEDGSKAAVELKSMYGRGIANIQKSGEPKLDYLKQIFVYSQIGDIQAWLHPYLGRDNGYRTEFWIERVPEGLLVNGDKLYRMKWENAIQKLVEVEAAVEAGEAPPRDFLVAIKKGEIKEMGFQKDNVKYKGDWQCHYCDWKSKCWAPVLEEYTDSDNSAMFADRKGGEDGSD